jgi:hypothetical protein
MKAALLLVAFGCLSAFGQDDAASMAMQAAQQANQQAMQAAQQANEQATQASQQASQQAMQDSQNAAQNNGPVTAMTRQPSFSVKAGDVVPGTTVRIKSSTHYAVIYYTTNGWTPTTVSRRYTGPIPIHATTELQAMAIAPNSTHSFITRATYTVKGSLAPPQPLDLSADGMLHAGTRLHLITNSAANSKTAQVGDNLSLILDQDVKMGDTVVASKGSVVDATISQADPAGHAGAPGDIAFVVHSVQINGVKILLQGGETLEGADRYKSRYFMLIPAVGVIPALATRGEEAEIKPGMTLTAAVAADTMLRP